MTAGAVRSKPPLTARDRRLGIQVAEELMAHALSEKRKALHRGDDYQAAAWDEVKANARDAARSLRETSSEEYR